MQNLEFLNRNKIARGNAETKRGNSKMYTIWKLRCLHNYNQQNILSC